MATNALAHGGINRQHENYSPSLRTLHWLLVILVVAQVIVALSIPEGDTGQSPLWGVHATLGPLILIFALIRLLVRWTTHVPSLPADVPRWQHRLARLNQAALYAVLIIMPLTGWAIFSVHGNGPLMFGVIQLPPIVTPAPEGVDAKPLAEPYAIAHDTFFIILLVLVTLHVLGALYHGLVRKDGVLSSMTTGN